MVMKKYLTIEDKIQGERVEFVYSLLIGGKIEKKETKEPIEDVGLPKRIDCGFVICSE